MPVGQINWRLRGVWMGVAMRRFSQGFLQWFFIFGLLALVLTCFVLAGCATMAADRAVEDKWQTLADQATKQLHVAPVTVILVGGSTRVCLPRATDHVWPLRRDPLK